MPHTLSIEGIKKKYFFSTAVSYPFKIDVVIALDVAVFGA